MTLSGFLAFLGAHSFWPLASVTIATAIAWLIAEEMGL